MYMRASHNLILFDTWNQLGRPRLTPLPINVKGVNGQISYITGVLKTKLFYTNQHMHSVFLVMPAGELSENILLGCL